MIALVCVVVVCTFRRVGRSSGVWCSGGASALSACTRMGAGGLSLAQGRVAGRCEIGTFVLLEAFDARDGSVRDRSTRSGFALLLSLCVNLSLHRQRAKGHRE